MTRQRKWQKNTIGLYCWITHSRAATLNEFHVAVSYIILYYIILYIILYYIILYYIILYYIILYYIVLYYIISYYIILYYIILYYIILYYIILYYIVIYYIILYYIILYYIILYYIILYYIIFIHYAHAAANLNSGYSKYVKAARVHYFCTIAPRTSRAVLSERERRVGLIYASVWLIHFLNG